MARGQGPKEDAEFAEPLHGLDVHVSDLSGELCVIPADYWWTVSQLKAQVEAAMQIPMEQQQLVMSTREPPEILSDADVLGWHFVRIVAELTVLSGVISPEWLRLLGPEPPAPLVQLESKREANQKREWTLAVTLCRRTNRCVAFKLQTTAPGSYFVRPSQGILLGTGREATRLVTISLKEGAQADGAHRFLLQAVAVAPTAEPLGLEAWRSIPQRVIEKRKFKIDFAEDPADGVEKQQRESKAECGWFKYGHNSLRSLKLDADEELSLRRGVRRIILTQTCGDYVVWNIQTTTRGRYAVLPSRGVLSGLGSMQSVKITRHAGGKAGQPDGFLIQAVLRPTSDQVDLQSSGTVSKRLIQECRLEIDFSGELCEEPEDAEPGAVYEWLRLLGPEPPAPLVQLESKRAASHTRERILAVTSCVKRPVAFKLQTTALGSYVVRPNRGILLGTGSEATRLVTISINEGAQADGAHRFLLQAVATPTAEPLSLEAWRSVPPETIEKRKFTIDFAEDPADGAEMQQHTEAQSCHQVPPAAHATFQPLRRRIDPAVLAVRLLFVLLVALLLAARLIKSRTQD